jgi:glycosyltransferase involved in cell wall biosynthesis
MAQYDFCFSIRSTKRNAIEVIYGDNIVLGSYMKLNHYQRKPAVGFQSIERVFEDIRAKFSSDTDVRVVTSRYVSKGFFRRLFNVLEARIRQTEVNHVIGDVHFLACLLSKNTILTIHDCVMMHRLRGVRRWVYWFFWLWLPIQRSALVTVVSRSTQVELLRYVKINPKKVRLIHNGVSEEFCFSEKIFCQSTPVLLQVGTAPNKNLERVARALEGKKCKLVILGRLSDSQIQSLEMSGVTYESFSDLSREQVVERYKLADIIIFASTYEGFGLPIVEGNAIGRPVITSNRGSMKEVGEGAACLVDPEDVGSISAGIDKVIFDDAYRYNLIKRGLENIKRFSCTDSAANYEAIYKELLNRKNSRN